MDILSSNKSCWHEDRSFLLLDNDQPTTFYLSSLSPLLFFDEFLSHLQKPKDWKRNKMSFWTKTKILKVKAT